MIAMIGSDVWLSTVFITWVGALVGGAFIFVRNLLGKDSEYAGSFSWWLRLLTYFLAFVVPPAGLLAALGIYVFGKNRECIRFVKGILFVSLIPFLFYVVVYLDPNLRTIY